VRWALVPQPAVHIRTFGDDGSAIAYDDRSGDTFLLSALAQELLLRLAEQPAGVLEDLVDELARDLGAAAPGSLASDVQVELLRLSTRGLATLLPAP
jgi:PqqD family protein of HPr-rel-A system